MQILPPNLGIEKDHIRMHVVVIVNCVLCVLVLDSIAENCDLSSERQVKNANASVCS